MDVREPGEIMAIEQRDYGNGTKPAECAVA